MRIAKIVSPADAFTLINALLGLMAMIAASRGQLVLGIELILLAIIFDGLDGFVARRFGSKWLIGDYLDLMSDTTTFCVAPAFMIFAVYIDDLPGLLYVTDPGNLTIFIGCGMLVICGILRLARFCLMQDKTTDRFIGIPSAACALTLMLLMLMDLRMSERFDYDGLTLFIPAASIVLSAMMISDTYYWKMKGLVEWASGGLVLLVLVLNAYLEVVLIAFGVTVAYLIAGPFIVDMTAGKGKDKARSDSVGPASKAKAPGKKKKKGKGHMEGVDGGAKGEE